MASSRTPIPGQPPWPAGTPVGRPTGGFQRGAVDAVAQLPIVLAIGVTNLNATSVTLVGSVNPQGVSATWWFVWGLQLPNPENTTASAALAATATPTSVQANLAGLQTGLTYYFALVGRTSVGTVTSTLLSFVPATPNVPPSVNVVVDSPFASSLTIPHMEWPFKIVAGTTHVGAGSQILSQDGARVVQQDSDGDVDSCVQAILNCTQGEYPEDSSLGLPDLPFTQTPISSEAISATVLRQEPRSRPRVATGPLGDTTGRQWLVDVQNLRSEG